MSEHKQKAASRRDARNVKDEARPVATASKKDTKRWCGGHVGREHVPACVPYGGNRSPFERWRVLQCTTCGRKLDHYYPIELRRADGSLLPDSRPKPDWVTD